MTTTTSLQIRLAVVDSFGNPADMRLFDSLTLQGYMNLAADAIREGGPDADMAERVFDAINIELGRRGY